MEPLLLATGRWLQNQTGRKVSWLLWSCDTTFGRKARWGCSWNSSLKKTMYENLISDTLLAKVIAMRKAIFHDK